MTGVFEHGHLESEADAKEGDAVFTDMLHRGDLAFDATLAEAAGHDDGVHVVVSELATVPVEDLDDAEGDLFLALKALRLRLAHAQSVPPYVIFPDKALVDMAQRQPRTHDDFAQIHGVGKAKVKKFASPFLQEIAGFLGDTTDA